MSEIEDHIDTFAAQLKDLFRSQEREVVCNLKRQVEELERRVRTLEMRHAVRGPGVIHQPSICTCDKPWCGFPPSQPPPCPLHGFAVTEIITTCGNKAI